MLKLGKGPREVKESDRVDGPCVLRRRRRVVDGLRDVVVDVLGLEVPVVGDVTEAFEGLL